MTGIPGKGAVKVALGQFAVAKVWQENAETCVDLIRRAIAERASLLVLPEGILARDIADPDIVLKSAQPLDGPFVTRLAEATRGSDITVMLTIHTPNGAGRVHNVLIALRDGEIVAAYRKLHLYDAFSAKESTNVQPGDDVPPLVEVAGLKVGLMTCYDVRFPELARRLAHDGADVLVLPAAWVKGPLKEHHWTVLVTARALENTAYVVAVGECGERNIGHSMVVDPLGVVTASAGEAPALVFAEIDPARIAHARAVLPALANRRFARPELANRDANQLPDAAE
ncbi:deaminated glutathione amidase [Alsobacter sp. SYSU M60028]|uniref:Deaminated glutathione amidase n=1 Tax=Alsobacter ponti TaxID=2962936 RepID=A0ABT1L7U0_9HYPH|nr:deaminated glutathione amidase [Alsobacter ponti]MCP8937121.1 deaminated glutathione amidase [Alsobacter ponti]